MIKSTNDLLTADYKIYHCFYSLSFPKKGTQEEKELICFIYCTTLSFKQIFTISFSYLS